jgi:hypothetical protein
VINLLHFQDAKPNALEDALSAREKQNIRYDVKGITNAASADLEDISSD